LRRRGRCIGIGPTFMVRSIAGSRGGRMPSFAATCVLYSSVVLLPVFLLVSGLFFR
jgi:hypothetical protein